MIVLKEFPDKKFDSLEEGIKFLKENKETVIAQKRAVIKYTDAFSFMPSFEVEEKTADKAESTEQTAPSKLKLKLVINTCNILDSHGDVHISGIWNKTVKENKNLLLLQEHKVSFSNIISDNVKAKIEVMNWSDLGLNAKGSTEALVFNVVAEKERNPYMFEQYKKGFVKQHSVGMYYIKMFLCYNSDQDWAKEEKENWDKYIDSVINKKDAESKGYFWAVTEAKAIEGSAVVFGSNPITPTLEITETKSEPGNHSDTDKNEPPKGTQTSKKITFVKLKSN